MPEVTKGGSKEPIEIRIKFVRNGVMVCAYMDDEPTRQEYVYPDIKAALKEIAGLVSVLKEEQPKDTMKDLDKEEERINKGDY